MKDKGKPQQPTLFDTKQLPPHNGTPTSVAAAVSMRETAGSLRAKVFGYICNQHGAGATCDEIEEALGLRHQTASARVNELMNAGRIIEGSRRLTRSGRFAVAWIVADRIEGGAP